MAGAVPVGRPEPRRVRRQHLVDEDQLALGESELEFGVRHHDPPLQRMGCSELVQRKRQLLQALGKAATDPFGHLVQGDVDVVARGFLRRRREDGLGQTVRFHQPPGKLDAADAAAVLVFLPSRAGQITAGHALDRDDLGPPDQHGPPGQPVAVLSERLGERRHVGRDQVIGRHVLGLLEPVQGQPRQYPALVRDGLRQHDVERRDPVGRHHHQVGTGLEDVPNLPPSVQIHVRHDHSPWCGPAGEGAGSATCNFSSLAKTPSRFSWKGRSTNSAQKSSFDMAPETSISSHIRSRK